MWGDHPASHMLHRRLGCGTESLKSANQLWKLGMQYNSEFPGDVASNSPVNSVTFEPCISWPLQSPWNPLLMGSRCCLESSEEQRGRFWASRGAGEKKTESSHSQKAVGLPGQSCTMLDFLTTWIGSLEQEQEHCIIPDCWMAVSFIRNEDSGRSTTLPIA